MIGGELLKRVATEAGLTSYLINHSSADVCLHQRFRITNNIASKINPRLGSEHPLFWDLDVYDSKRQVLLLQSNQFVLAKTEEYIKMPENFSAMFSLRSVYARAGLEQSTSLFIHPGWEGHLVLELSNLAPWAIELTPGEPIGQLHFFRVEEE